MEVFSPKRFWIVLNPKLLLVCLAAAALVALVESGSLSKLGVILLCLIFAPAADPKKYIMQNTKTNSSSGIR